MNQNRFIQNGVITKKELSHFLSVMNSYLGIMRHYKTYNLRKRMLLKYLDEQWLDYVSIDQQYLKFSIKK
jgi:hypothetical protein